MFSPVFAILAFIMMLATFFVGLAGAVNGQYDVMAICWVMSLILLKCFSWYTNE